MGIDCTNFAEVWADLLDGRERPEAAAALDHAASCPECRELRDLAAEGQRWLRALPAVEAPAALVGGILAATRRPRPAPAASRPAWLEPWWDAFVSVARQPRLVNTAAMAFFSVALLVNISGIGLPEISDLRPSAITSRLTREYRDASARAVRYYENIRFVRELEVRVRDLRERALSEPDVEEELPSAAQPAGGRSYRPAPVLQNEEILVHG